MKIRGLVIKVGVFAAAMILVLVGVFRTIEAPVDGKTDSYTAMFTDANGLRVGDDVRRFGVGVGKVSAIELDGIIARVDFTVLRGTRLSLATQPSIRYQNLTGRRYIDVTEPADSESDSDAAYAPGTVIGVDDTVGSFDVTTLFNGLQPVLADLSAADLNKFTASMLAVIEGEGNGIGPALDAIETLSRHAVDRQAVISTLVRNFSLVSEQIGGRSTDAITLITELTALFKMLEEKVPLLVDFSVQIPPILDPLDHMMEVIGLTGDPNPPVQDWFDAVFADTEDALAALRRLPGLIGFLAALTPEDGRLRCSGETAQTPAALNVLLGAQRITLCQGS